jgi:hypothetical protein
MKKLFILLMALTAVSLSAWEYYDNEDLMTGVTERVMYLEADVSQGTLSSPMLTVRYDGEYRVYVYWGGYTLDWDLKSVMVRIGTEDYFFHPATLSTTGESTFFESPEEFVRHLDGRVVMLVVSATGREMVALWEIEDITGALRQLTDGE